MTLTDKKEMAKEMAGYLNDAYSKIPPSLQTASKPQLKWPSGISWSKANDVITLRFNEDAIKKNMQTDDNAFESWILAMVALGKYDPFFHCNYSVTFYKLDKSHADAGDEERVEWQHYQRFLFRLNQFFELFGTQWFLLNDEDRKLAASSEYFKYELKCNTGGGLRDIPPDMSKIDMDKLSESQLEWFLSKHSKSDRFKNSIPKTFTTGEVYRQFPIGIFKQKVSKECSLFPSGKACIDLVAVGGDDTSFWIFELKKKGNKALGIVSELLFYVAIVGDIITGNIAVDRPKDTDCYNPQLLRDKTAINACFLAPDFHPLFLNSIIDILNDAFRLSGKRIPVIFHKAVLDTDSGRISEVSK